MTEQDTRPLSHLPYHLTIDDLANEILRRSRSAVFDFLDKDQSSFPIPALLCGRDRLWNRDEVLAWVASQRPTTMNPRRDTVIRQTRNQASIAIIDGSTPDRAAAIDPLAGFTTVRRERQAA